MSDDATENFRFAPCTPPAARDRIVSWYGHPLADDESRAMLKRLATYDAMKTEVWQKLPVEPKEGAASIVDWVFGAYYFFPRLRRPYPKSRSKAAWADWTKHLERYPPAISPAFVANLARLLAENMRGLAEETELWWPSLWQGDKSHTPNSVLAAVEQLSAFYQGVAEQYAAMLSPLPKVKRWRGQKPARKFFTEHLSQCMQATYGQQHDAIVAALEAVAFNLPEGTSAETVRGRRR